ncbi:MAG TPA: ADP-ribosylglycohydrolase family protein [Thermomicrobiales bacterium]|nr:ADP-ribosylglycohydrolase family protein [Thermomicrobiales bacterium]
MPVPHDYTERVYAGVLGKIIGVYLGRPFEGWSYDRIMAELGEITYYVHDRMGQPLIVTDDDISGTFTFLRALPDHGNDPNLTPAQIGESWLNYIIEGRTILWWGGLGNSTEHTAYLRLKEGIEPPRSGSIELNTRVVAEQIGSQIFIDGWAMVAPGDPERAADFARRAASVSHDGEAIYGAQVVAAMEAQAFVESDIDRLIDTGVSLIPRDSVIARMIAEIRDWYAGERDWRKARELIAAKYGYDKYPGNCHMVPNHALIIHSLLYGDDDFQKSLMIVNTSGWDTDCNSGNVGCILGIKKGLAAFDGDPDWRGPVADRLYLATAEGGRGISDAVAESFHIINIGRALSGEQPISPKEGARFHFDLPGSVQGFQAEDDRVTVENVAGHSESGERSLAIRYGDASGAPARVSTPTFIPPEAFTMHYTLLASPTLHPGQTVRARVTTDGDNPGPLRAHLFIRHYDGSDNLVPLSGPEATIPAGESHEYTWRVPETDGQPIAQLGLEADSGSASGGTLYLDYMTWDGAPDMQLGRPGGRGEMWRRAWVNGVDQFEARWPEPYRVVQNHGTGLLMQGSQDWTDYRVSAPVTVHLAKSSGVAARVGGLRRYYALLLCDDGKARLVKACDGITTLAEADFPWEVRHPYELSLVVTGDRIEAAIDDEVLFDMRDQDRPLLRGGIGLICEKGCLSSDAVTVRPVGR